MPSDVTTVQYHYSGTRETIMESGQDTLDIEPDTLDATTTAAGTNKAAAAIATTQDLDRPTLQPPPRAPWKDIGTDTYSSEYESEALSASCAEPTDSWLSSPTTTTTTAGEGRARDLPTTFYPSRPRTITLLVLFVLVLVGTAFQRESSDLESDVWDGIYVASFSLLTVGVLVFPTGPFTYPHPVVWRLLFGVSLLYLLALDFVLFQQYRHVRAIMLSLDPEESPTNSTARAGLSDDDGCALSFRNVWTKMDRSASYQTLCWAVKAMVVRDSGVLWVLNFLQGITEAYLKMLLAPTPTTTTQGNEYGCWWQSMALNPLVFNALGIQTGMYVCKKLEMMELQWEEIISLKNTAAKLKRAVLHFTPEAWSRIRWLDLNATQYKRFVGAVALLLGVQLMNLNGVFLRHVFQLSARHRLVLARTVLLSLIGAPSVQQLYLYITGRPYGRLGSQCWVYFAIVLSELVVLARFGKVVMSEELRKDVSILMLIVVLSSGAAIGLLAFSQHKGLVRIPSYRRKKLRKRRKIQDE